MPPPRLVQIAVIGAAHGVRGELRVKTFTEDPSSLGAYGPLSLADGRRLKVASSRLLKGEMVVARFEGVTTREAAEALTGEPLSVPREALPEPDEDEFYHADLIGLRAELPDGTPFGEIVAAPNFGADDLLEVRLANESRTVLLPFIQDVVLVVDLRAGRIIIDPPKGTIDEPTASNQ